MYKLIYCRLCRLSFVYAIVYDLWTVFARLPSIDTEREREKKMIHEKRIAID